MNRLWIVGVVLLCACGAAQPAAGPVIAYSTCDVVNVHSDGSGSEEEVASLDEGLALWAEAGLTTLSTTATDATSQVPVHFEDAPAPFHGLYEPTTGVVYINKKLSGLERAITVAHEVGHALGLPHVAKEERPSLMNPGNLTVRPTPDDLATLRAKWGCPSSP